jgi:hypothetical protein
VAFVRSGNRKHQADRSVRVLRVLRLGLLCAFLIGLDAGAAAASPWAEVGDTSLRSDIEILATARMVDGITSQWPMSWRGLYARLDDNTALTFQPSYVAEAAGRVRTRAIVETRSGFQTFAMADLTNQPSVIRDFGALGRQDAQAGLSMQYNMDTTSFRLNIGMQTTDRYDRQTLMFDGSYIAQLVGNSIVYAGYMPHWWGPGWMSALSLSNNARPFPHVGIMRADTSAFQWPVLRWLGPWQLEAFVGVLDGATRVNRNVLYNAVRFSINPLPGLEIGVARMDEMCGTGNPCKPLAEWFHFSNHVKFVNGVPIVGVNQTNDEGLIDIHYSGHLGRMPFSLYAQEMNEVQSNPLPQSVSHLYGASIWAPRRDGMLRLTLEWASTIPTYQLFWGHDDHGFAYNNGQYPDGMRYRNRSLGFSLDSDSQLLSLSGDWTSDSGIEYQLMLHHADVSNPFINSKDPNVHTTYNAVTTAPVRINMAEARVSFPLRRMMVDLAVRAQDDQPRPDHGFTAAVEMRVRAAL